LKLMRVESEETTKSLFRSLDGGQKRLLVELLFNNLEKIKTSINRHQYHLMIVDAILHCDIFVEALVDKITAYPDACIICLLDYFQIEWITSRLSPEIKLKYYTFLVNNLEKLPIETVLNTLNEAYDSGNWIYTDIVSEFIIRKLDNPNNFELLQHIAPFHSEWLFKNTNIILKWNNWVLHNVFKIQETKNKILLTLIDLNNNMFSNSIIDMMVVNDRIFVNDLDLLDSLYEKADSRHRKKLEDQIFSHCGELTRDDARMIVNRWRYPFAKELFAKKFFHITGIDVWF